MYRFWLPPGYLWLLQILGDYLRLLQIWLPPVPPAFTHTPLKWTFHFHLNFPLANFSFNSYVLGVQMHVLADTEPFLLDLVPFSQLPRLPHPSADSWCRAIAGVLHFKPHCLGTEGSYLFDCFLQNITLLNRMNEYKVAGYQCWEAPPLEWVVFSQCKYF